MLTHEQLLERWRSTGRGICELELEDALEDLAAAETARWRATEQACAHYRALLLLTAVAVAMIESHQAVLDRARAWRDRAIGVGTNGAGSI